MPTGSPVDGVWADSEFWNGAAATAFGTAINNNLTDIGNLETGKADKSTLTAKGDLYVASASGVVTRLAVGANNQVLTADSAQTVGVKWATPTSGFADPLTTAGDIIVRGASATVRKGVGTNGQILQVNTANADKLAYVTPDKNLVGLGSVDNLSLIAERTLAVAYTNKTIDGDLNTITHVAVSALKTTGPASSTTVLYGDGVWRTPSGGTGGGLTFIDNNDGTGDLVGASFTDNNDGTATV
jgi:hypothetical protein